MRPGRILVSGANGYIASRLIPRLLEHGYEVRAMARNPARLKGRAWATRVELQWASTAEAGSLGPAMAGVHTAYYLVHSMRLGRGYDRIERESAQRFAAAAAQAGVEHIIYLGGLADPREPHLAPHMRSRIETGEVLRSGSVTVTEFRAGVIAGAGSISFEMIRFLTECFPMLPGPRWLENRTQPIAAENVIDYLVAGLERKEAWGGMYELGGPETMRYADTMLRYAKLRGLKRTFFAVPWIPIWWMALVVDRLTPVPYRIATALIGGLQSDSIVSNDAASKLFPEVELASYEQAIRAALSELMPDRLERVWEGLESDVADFRHEGFIVDCRRREVAASEDEVFAQLGRMGGKHPWPFADWLWRLRGSLDRLLARGRQRTEERPQSETLSEGAVIDYYRAERVLAPKLLRLHSELVAPGEGWMEWTVQRLGDGHARLTQTAFFAPRGLPGFLYWFCLGPLHRIVFRGLIDALKHRSESA